MTRPKTVLVVTSSYAPAMIADMHRARHLAWELPALGWNVEILAPGESYQFANSLDRDSDGFFCASTPVHYAPAQGAIARRVVRTGTIGWRALIPLYVTGRNLLRQRRFDLVYFSTTQFNLFLLGGRWRAELGVPYVLDIHDPISRTPRPGERSGAPGIKGSINRWILREIEPRALRSAAGLVSVSAHYLDALRDRHGEAMTRRIPRDRQVVVPFAGSERDLMEAGSRMPQSARLPGGVRRVVYVGAGGYLMARAFAVFCRALREAIDAGALGGAALRVELYGTMSTWREGDRKDLWEIAQREGVAEYVVEDPRRVSYRKSLELLLGADGALILGVDDDGYMPSKLYTYALSGRPLLAVLRRGSEGAGAFDRLPQLGHLMAFGDARESGGADRAPLAAFIGEVVAGRAFDRRNAIGDHLAPAMAAAHARLFDACVRDAPARAS